MKRSYAMKTQKKKYVLHQGAESNQPCCPMGTDVAKAAAGTLFMASELLVRYETDIGIDTQPMADLLSKAVSDWAIKHGASQSELEQALQELQKATADTRLGAVH